MGDSKRLRMDAGAGWEVKASLTSHRTVNPIRAIVDGMDLTPNPAKTMIRLSIGDPTVFRNMDTPKEVQEAVINVVKTGRGNGYPPSVGYDDSRKAIAENFGCEDAPLTEKDIIITSGCSGALDISIAALANEGDNILVPQPGFSLYKTVSLSRGIETQSYRLLPEQDWQCDIAHMKSLVNDKTKAIVVTNPSNPCGSLFSREHLLEILAVAEEFKVPIIADEIYADMVFSGNQFHAIAPLSKNVPILVTGGLAKRYVVPGWRVGWICIHDRHGIFEKEVRDGLTRLSQIILGANSLVQAALRSIFQNTPKSFYDQMLGVLEDNAKLCYNALSVVKGLKPVQPKAAMYMMVGIDVDQFDDAIKDDTSFTENLLKEQSVFCLPAKVFEYPNYFRIVTTIPVEKMEEAMNRIAEFCDNHRKK